MAEQTSDVPSHSSVSLFANASGGVTVSNCTFHTHNHLPSSNGGTPGSPIVSNPVSVPSHSSGLVTTPSQIPQALPEWLKIYQRQTQKFNLGYALWDPRPDGTVDVSSYRRDGLDIGDVGMITSAQGNFHYYFNMALQETHAKNLGRTPNNFQRFKLSSYDTRATATPVSSNLLTSVKLDLERNMNTEETCEELKFSGSSNDCHEAVIIFVGDGFEGKAMELSTEKRARQWAHAHAYEWYRHLMSRPHSIVNGDLRVIIGFEKTTYWGSATFTGVENNATDNFLLHLRVFDRPPRHSRCVWNHSGAVWASTSVGPDERETARIALEGGGLLRNQAIFVKEITVTLSDDEWERLEAELANMLHISGGSHQGKSTTRTSNPSVQKPKQPGCFSSFPRFSRAGKLRTAQRTHLSASFSSESPSGGSDSSEEDYDWNYDSDSLSSVGLSTEELPPLGHTCDETKWRGVKNHPCSLLNKELLERVIKAFFKSDEQCLLMGALSRTGAYQVPHAKTAVTSDNDWIRVLKEDDEVELSPAELVTRIMETHDIVVEDYMVFVQPRENLDPQLRSYISVPKVHNCFQH